MNPCPCPTCREIHEFKVALAVVCMVGMVVFGVVA
jgi:hypothetical protein